MASEKQRPTLFIIDISNMIFRAFYALPRLRTSRGEPTGAIYGVTRMIQKIVREMKPDYVAVAMDSPTLLERKKIYEEYKAHRSPPPDDLCQQIPVIETILKLYGFKSFTSPGWEADDVIASLTKEALGRGISVRIVSGDKDLAQLVAPNVRLLYDDSRTKQMVELDEKGVEEKYGVPPSLILDLLAMVGDTSDNIPGIPKVGAKTAVELLRRFGSLQAVLGNLDKIGKPALRETIEQNKEKVLLSKRLVTLRDDLFEGMEFDLLLPSEPAWDELVQQLRRFELKELLTDIERDRPRQAEKAPPPGTGGEKAPYSEATGTTTVSTLRITPLSGKKEYFAVLELDALESEIRSATQAGAVSVDLETTGLDPVSDSIVGISLSWRPDRGCYIPVGHRYMGVPPQLPLEEVLARLKPLLENPHIEKYGHHIKFDDMLLMRAGIFMKGIAFDTMVASYLLDPEKHQHKLDQVAMSELQYRMITYEEVTRKTRGSQLRFEEVPIEDAAIYSSEDAEVVFTLVQRMRPELERAGLMKLLLKVELPLSRVLAKMQMAGISIDTEYLAQLEKEFAVELEAIEKEVWRLAGTPFNLASPKQLQEVLFKRLGIATTRKTKTGFSTASDVLETIDHPIAEKILDYRALQKLLGTYVRALPQSLNRETGKLHTSYNQAVAATGRLSSSDPNLQNIPIRTERGRKIRRAFVPSQGCRLMSADYSQIDLRVLAHLSGDPVLTEAFRRGEDVHTRTAMEIFGVDRKDVTTKMRASAKAINFGVIYGQTEYGLAQQTGLSRKEAKLFIERYFERYAGVRRYMNSVIEEARKGQGVNTILGRRRFLRGIDSRNKNERAMAERMARNTPIQGSAADIIKLAMIRISNELERMGLASKMLLSIHDELVFDVPIEESHTIQNLVVSAMQTIMELSVPLVVEVGWGDNWADTHP